MRLWYRRRAPGPLAKTYFVITFVGIILFLLYSLFRHPGVGTLIPIAGISFIIGLAILLDYIMNRKDRR